MTSVQNVVGFARGFLEEALRDTPYRRRAQQYDFGVRVDFITDSVEIMGRRKRCSAITETLVRDGDFNAATIRDVVRAFVARVLRPPNLEMRNRVRKRAIERHIPLAQVRAAKLYPPVECSP